MENPHADHGGAFFEAIGVGFDHLERRNEIVNADVLDAWYDPSPRVLEALKEHLPWLLRTSPPTHGEGLVAAIATARGFSSESILIGAGSSSLMYQALPRLVPMGGRVVVPDPTYGEYPHLVEQILGAELVRVRCEPQKGWIPDAATIAEAARNADLVIMVNPNSPTGAVLPTGWIESLLGRLGTTTRLWVDETYVDFADPNRSVERLVAQDARLIVSKSMSKYYGLSGVRVGYLVLARELRRELEASSPPWPVGLIAQVAAVAALNDPDYYRNRAKKTRELSSNLGQMIGLVDGLRPFPTVANFLLVGLDRGTSKEWNSRLREMGVFVRDCSSISRLLKDRYLRIAVKDEATNDRLVESLKAVARQIS